MFNYPNSLEELIESLRKLPSVGRKSAQRMALHIVDMDIDKINSLITSLESARDNISRCEICGNLTENKICSICKDHSRNSETICVVEDVTNLLTIENTNTFNGKYHVLKGLIKPSSMLDTERLGIDAIVNRVKNQDINELIFAISPTVEGETTMLFIKELLRDSNVKFTRIASGIPVGGNLEYFDEITLSKALEDRRAL